MLAGEVNFFGVKTSEGECIGIGCRNLPSAMLELLLDAIGILSEKYVRKGERCIAKKCTFGKYILSYQAILSISNSLKHTGLFLKFRYFFYLL